MSRSTSTRPNRLGAAEVSSRWQDSQMLLELQRPLGSHTTASQDAKRSIGKLRLPSDWPRTGIRLSGRHDVVFRVKSDAEEPVGGTRRSR